MREDSPAIKAFGNRLRTRICGILVEGERVLMLRHATLGRNHLWAPPGGGLDYAERTEDALRREFREETGLEVEVVRFLFVHEFLQPPLHAIELFYEVKAVGGALRRGEDPEMEAGQQIIERVAWLDFAQIKAEDPRDVHHALSFCDSVESLLAMRGKYDFLPEGE